MKWLHFQLQDFPWNSLRCVMPRLLLVHLIIYVNLGVKFNLILHADHLTNSTIRLIAHKLKVLMPQQNFSTTKSQQLHRHLKHAFIGPIYMCFWAINPEKKSLLWTVVNVMPNFLAANLKICSTEDALDDGIGTACKDKVNKAFTIINTIEERWGISHKRNLDSDSCTSIIG